VARPPRPASNGRLPPGSSPSIRGRRRTRTPTVTRSPDFESGTASMTVSSSMAKDGVIETHSQGATRIPDGDRTLAASSSTTESGRLERHGRSRALVSSEARSLIGSLSMITSYRSADSNREPPGSEPGASTELG
jgi:hypothetical protein